MSSSFPCSGATAWAPPTHACTAWSSTVGTPPCGGCRTGTRRNAAPPTITTLTTREDASMEEGQLRALIEQVRAGALSRRRFVQTMVGLGLTAPLAVQMLASAGGAAAQAKVQYAPTKRGGGGALKVLWWQSPTLLNPHFATGTKDQDGSRVFYEPLAGWDADGHLRPILAASVPSLEDGTLGKDGKSAIWKLKTGVTWHDGKPFTADDCVFTWEYARDPATA